MLIQVILHQLDILLVLQVMYLPRLSKNISKNKDDSRLSGIMPDFQGSILLC
jgi:hypothetical protein